LVIIRLEKDMNFLEFISLQNTSGLFPVFNTDLTIFNIFCTAFLSLLTLV